MQNTKFGCFDCCCCNSLLFSIALFDAKKTQNRFMHVNFLLSEILLGIWKPISLSPVCDYPLAVMDSSTLDFDHHIPVDLSVNLPNRTLHFLAADIVHSPEQRWYYYPFQTQKEVLIFHQYSEGKQLANPHTSFLNKNCPKGSASRISVDMRVALFF